MQQNIQVTKPKVEAVYNQLKSENFDDVKSFLVNREGYTAEKVEAMQEEYIKFIALCSEHATKAKPIVISNQVDPFWHTHILFTNKYRGMCERIFGKEGAYLDHNPTKTEDDVKALEDSYKGVTLPLYEKYFGLPSGEFWPENAMICGGANCSCSGTGNA